MQIKHFINPKSIELLKSKQGERNKKVAEEDTSKSQTKTELSVTSHEIKKKERK